MSGDITLAQDLRHMSFHDRHGRMTKRHGRTASRVLLKLCASVSTFAITLGSSGTLNAPQGFSPAYAAGEVPDAFADLEPMNQEALDEARGGFSVGNVNIHVGVTVETAIDGFVTVTTNFTMSMPGLLQNMGTDIKTITDAATQAANAAVEAANVAVAAANAATSQAVGGATSGGTNGNANTGTANTGNTITTGSVTGATQTLNGTPESTGGGTGGSLLNNPTVTEATHSLSQAAGQVAADLQAVSQPPAAPYNDSMAGGSGGSTDTPAPKVISVVATGKESPGSNTAEAASVKVVGTSKNGDTLIVPANTGNMAEIIHDTTQGHTTVITNTLNNVTIRQTVSMNMTVDNFSALQNVSSLNRTVTSLSRQIGLLGLRH